MLQTWTQNRVTYQGITYTICTWCYDVIGSGRTEETLLALESTHHCAAMNDQHRNEIACEPPPERTNQCE